MTSSLVAPAESAEKVTEIDFGSAVVTWTLPQGAPPLFVEAVDPALRDLEATLEWIGIHRSASWRLRAAWLSHPDGRGF